MRCGAFRCASNNDSHGRPLHPPHRRVPGVADAHGVEQLIDVRTIPKSRRNPQYNTDALAKSLQAAHIQYRHMPGLGGLRHPRKNSINSAWQNDSFRGYADYMQTPAFEASLRELIEARSCHRTVIMCAEAVPWRCHRSLIARCAAGARHRGRRYYEHQARQAARPDFFRARGRRESDLPRPAALSLAACAACKVSVYCWKRVTLPSASVQKCANCASIFLPVALYAPV